MNTTISALSPRNIFSFPLTRIVTLVILAILAPGAFALDFRANLDVQPGLSGSCLTGDFQLIWKEGQSSGLRLSHDVDTSVGDIPGVPDSVLGAISADTRVTLSAWTMDLGSGGLSLDLGAAFRREKLTEKGSYDEADTTTQVYDNEVVLTTLGPQAAISWSGKLGAPAALQARLSVVPVFGYWYHQAITIDPLVAEPGTSSQNYLGFPMASLDLDLGLFDLLSIGGSYDLSLLPFDILTLNASRDGFTLLSTSVMTHEYAIRAEVQLPLGDRAKLRLGGTMANEWAVDMATGESTAAIPDPRFGLILGIRVR